MSNITIKLEVEGPKGETEIVAVEFRRIRMFEQDEFYVKLNESNDLKGAERADAHFDTMRDTIISWSVDKAKTKAFFEGRTAEKGERIANRLIAELQNRLEPKVVF